MVNEVRNIDCENCDKLISCCCKNCFVENQNNVFKSLNTKELDFLIDGKQQIVYKPGETIIKQNTSTTYVVCIKDGLAKLFVEGVKGKNIVVKLVKRGDFITGGGLFNGNVQKFTISAVTETKCCLINASKVTELFSQNSNFAVDILRHHTKQNNMLLEMIVNLTQKYMPGRVADTLLYLNKEIYLSEKFKSHLSRQELADMSNMTKESFVRILQQFKESKLIDTQGTTVNILNKKGLISVSKNG